jgi:hypothetical protein
MNADMEGGVDAAGQSAEQPEAGLEAQKEFVENPSGKVSRNRNKRDRGRNRSRRSRNFRCAKICYLRHEAKLAELREGMGTPPTAMKLLRRPDFKMKRSSSSKSARKSWVSKKKIG